MKNSYSRILKLSLFATGLAGIVAEYVLATMATYFLGDSVFQWTIILSFMLFSMGLGSRVSKVFKKNLIETYIAVELGLSLLTSFSAIFVYAVMPYTHSIDVIIYGQAILIGFLIGMEIPLVTRINGAYEELRSNISNMMENDYYGSLLGGLFFAFIGIKYLGLTYIPFVVGGVNLLVALIVILKFRSLLTVKKKLYIAGGVILCLFTAGALSAGKVVQYGNQSRYNEKVIFTEQTPYQQITVTQWQEDYWLYLNQGKQLSSFDEWMYHEPLVHPVMSLTKGPVDVLVMGAGDGCAIRELLKYPRVNSITLVDLDSVMTNIGKEHPIFRKINQDAYYSEKVNVVNADAFNYLEGSKKYYDVIIADFPDPRTIELNRLYSYEFYQLCHKRLRPHGALITQASSPYYTTKAFRSIEKTIGKVGFHTLPIHNHVYTFGEWGWIIGSKSLKADAMKDQIHNMKLNEFDSRWLSKDALLLLTSFGRDLIEVDTSKIEVNSIHNPVIYRYYEDGNWSYYF